MPANVPEPRNCLLWTQSELSTVNASAATGRTVADRHGHHRLRIRARKHFSLVGRGESLPDRIPVLGTLPQLRHPLNAPSTPPDRPYRKGPHHVESIPSQRRTVFECPPQRAAPPARRAQPAHRPDRRAGRGPWAGKTRLLADLAEEAQRRGFMVLSGRCNEFEQAVPFRPFTQILGGRPMIDVLDERRGRPRTWSRRMIVNPSIGPDAPGTPAEAERYHLSTRFARCWPVAARRRAWSSFSMTCTGGHRHDRTDRLPGAVAAGRAAAAG